MFSSVAIAQITERDSLHYKAQISLNKWINIKSENESESGQDQTAPTGNGSAEPTIEATIELPQLPVILVVERIISTQVEQVNAHKYIEEIWIFL